MSKSLTFDIKTDSGTFVIGRAVFNGEDRFVIENYFAKDILDEICFPDGIHFFKSNAFNSLYCAPLYEPRVKPLPNGNKFCLKNNSGKFYGISGKQVGNILVDFEAKSDCEVIEMPSLFTGIHPEALKCHYEESCYGSIFNNKINLYNQ